MRPTILRGALTFIFLLTVGATSPFAQTRARGFVIDIEQKPVEGASVCFEAQSQPGNGGKFARLATTNSKGEFIFIGLPRGEYKIIARKGDATDTITVELADTPEAKSRVIEFTLRPEREAAGAGAQTADPCTGTTHRVEAGIAGHVTDTARQALPGVAITAVDTTGVVRRTTSGGDGRYRLNVAPNRTYRIDFDLPHFDLFRSYNLLVLPEATVTIDATLPVSARCECVTVAEPSYMERAGRILDDTGRPLAHARLQLVTNGFPHVALADAEGRFRVRLPVDVSWPLEASDSGFEPVTQGVSGAGTNPIVFTLSRMPAPGPQYGERYGERFSRGCCPGLYFVHSGP